MTPWRHCQPAKCVRHWHLRLGGRLYVSEPVYAELCNDLIWLSNAEGVALLAAHAAQPVVDATLLTGRWQQLADRYFQTPRPSPIS